MKICFLASGNGGNLKFVYKTLQKLKKTFSLYVLADRQCGAIEFAQSKKIYSNVIFYSQENNKNLKKELENIKPDIIITNWHKIIDEEIVSLYSEKMINLHYSLLPSFGGMIGIKPIEEAYRLNCKYIGATCHYVDKNVDSGKIISQTIIKNDIALEDAIEKTFQNACLILLNSIFIVLNIKIENSNFEDFIFSPNLVYDKSIFDTDFWKELKKL